MKLKEKYNYFNIHKNVLNISKFNKNYKFRSYFRYFLKQNLYNLIKKKLLILIKFNNNLLLNNRFKLNNNNFNNIKNNIINSKTFNYIYVLKKENNLNKKSKNFNKFKIRKIYIIRKSLYKKKNKRFKLKFLRFIKLLKNIKNHSIDFKYYKILFKMISISKKINKEFLSKKINYSNFFTYNKFKTLNFLFLLKKKKLLNLKINKYHNFKTINLNKIKFNNFFYEDNKKKFKFIRYVKKNNKINKFKTILLKNIILINNIKNILNITY